MLYKTIKSRLHDNISFKASRHVYQETTMTYIKASQEHLYQSFIGTLISISQEHLYQSFLRTFIPKYDNNIEHHI